MKQIFKPLAILFIAGLAMTSCRKETKQVDSQISEETMTKISNLGFSTNDVQIIDEGYLVEEDIIITPEFLNSNTKWSTISIANEEQYRTNNLVTGLPRAITVSVSGNVSSSFSASVDNAIARYNTENLQIAFQRVASGGDIVIKIVNTGQYIASAGFPTNSGDPYNTVKYAKKYMNYSDGFVTTVLAHEMGHCIGFRHTDYMNRSYSCGIGGNEGDGGVGAVHIPGTPTDPDKASWMLACLSSTTNRPFNSNDKTALNYLY